MYNRRNSYLDRKMRERDYRRNDYRGGNRGDYNYNNQDGRNPYGSAGGYVRDHRGNDYAMGYGNDYSERNRGYDYRGNSDYRMQDYARSNQYNGQRDRNNDYAMYGYGMIQPMYNDYRMDYDHLEKEYHEELKKWIEKLKQKDNRIRVNKEQIMRQAKNMNVRFEDYNEEEFYATYLMMIADFPNVTNDYNVYLSMAKNWLEDDDVKVKGSDKLCTYLYEIVLGKSKEDDD